MKCLIVLVFSALAAVQALENPQERKELILNTWKVCREISKIGDEQRAQLHKGIIEENETVKNYNYCVLEKLDIVNDKNEILAKDEFVKRFKDVVDVEKIIKIVDECNEKKATPKETAFSFTKCAFKFNPLDKLPALN